jgi:rod shape-determining protein MreD
MTFVILPSFSILLAVFSTAVPWGLPSEATFVLPLMVVTLTFCWRAMPEAALPAPLAMLFGLLTDIMTGGPLGFWGLMVLTAHTVGRASQPLTDRYDPIVLCTVWTPLVCALGALGWLIASVFFLRWIDWEPIAFGVLASIAIAPAVVYVISRFRYEAYARPVRLGGEA